MANVDLVFEQLKVGPMDNFSYVFGDPASGEGAIVDPAFQLDRLLETARDEGLEVIDILVTHSHQDHVAQLDEARERTGATVWAHPKAQVVPDRLVKDGERFQAGGVAVKAVHTPGHCPDHVAYVVADQVLLSGDALFIGECGRVDLPGSDVDAMFETLMRTIPSLDPSLEVYPGHDYGPAPHRPLSVELKENYTLEKRDREAFRAFMAKP